jgi:hypothetical protein
MHYGVCVCVCVCVRARACARVLRQARNTMHTHIPFPRQVSTYLSKPTNYQRNLNAAELITAGL